MSKMSYYVLHVWAYISVAFSFVGAWYLAWGRWLKPQSQNLKETISYGEPMFWVCSTTFVLEIVTAVIFCIVFFREGELRVVGIGSAMLLLAGGLLGDILFESGAL